MEFIIGQLIVVFLALLGWRVTHKSTLKQSAAAFKMQQRFRVKESALEKLNFLYETAVNFDLFFLNTAPGGYDEQEHEIDRLWREFRISHDRALYYLRDYNSVFHVDTDLELTDCFSADEKMHTEFTDLFKNIQQIVYYLKMEADFDRQQHLRQDFAIPIVKYLVVLQRIRDKIREDIQTELR